LPAAAITESFCRQATGTIFAGASAAGKYNTMKYSKWIGLLSVITVIIVCYTPWVYITSAQLEIGGMFANGKHNFGKPGLMNIFCSAGAAILFLLPQIWAKRTNIFFCGFNIAWAIRNYILLSRCYGGECPVKKAGFYLLLVAAAVMLAMSLMPDVTITGDKSQDSKA
jgi:hypothetical protein